MMSSVHDKSALVAPKKPWLITGAAVLLLLVAMAIDTTIIVIGSDQDLRQQAFSPDSYGLEAFPRIRKFVTDKAVDASDLAAQLSADKKAATHKHATMAGAFPVFPVRFTGIVGTGKSGIFDIVVDGMPDGAKIRVQSGPAINGTELRDIPGDIAFGSFTNQIEYQNVGAGINKAMSKAILSDLDRDALTGKTVTIIGAFKMINPKNWLVTPVAFSVQ